MEYKSDGRTFNYLSKVKPPLNKSILIQTKEDEVIACKAIIALGEYQFNFTDFDGYADESEVIGWSF